MKPTQWSRFQSRRSTGKLRSGFFRTVYDPRQDVLEPQRGEETQLEFPSTIFRKFIRSFYRVLVVAIYFFDVRVNPFVVVLPGQWRRSTLK